MVQDELSSKTQEIIHNLVIQREDKCQVQCVILSLTLNLLARINYPKDNGVLITSHRCRCGRLIV